MNIFRELRRVKKKNILVKIKLLLIFSIMLTVSTFAWYNTIKKISLKSLRGETASWDVEYVIDDKVQIDEDVIITVDKIYPRNERLYKKYICKKLRSK